MNWLLIRGLTREARHWGCFTEQLKKNSHLVDLQKGDTVLCLDLPGAGQETHRRSPLTIEKITHDLRVRWLIEKTKSSSSSWGLLTISLGGMIGLQWAALFPNDFQALVTINTSAKNLAPWSARLHPYALMTILRVMLTRDTRKRQKLLISLTSQQHKSSQALVDDWADIEKSKSVSLTTLLAQLTAAATFHLPKEISVPLLVLSSLEDKIAAPICSDNLAKKYRAHRAVHPTAGHDIPLDDPDWVLNQLSEFVREISS